MTTGKIISMSIDGVEIRTDPVKEARHRIASMTTAEWAQLYWSAPVSACAICGCAHRSPYDACNSCCAGQLVAQQQLTVERLKRAGRRMAEACSSAAAHAVAMGAMLQFSNLGPVYVMSTPGRHDERHYSAFMADPVHVDLGGVDMPWKTESVAIFDDGWRDRGMLIDATRFDGAFYFDQSRPPAEPRPKRDRRNRGPQQHGKWWTKRSF